MADLLPDPMPGERRDEPDRRGGERRRFRFGFGRRDEAAGRRSEERGPRGATALILALSALVVVGLGVRFAVVAPARAARSEAAAIHDLTESALGGLALPMQAIPGFAPPREGDPSGDAALTPELRATLLALAERLDRATKAAPGELAPYPLLGDLRLALGDEGPARRAYYEALALGDPRTADHVRVAIAALTLRAAHRAADEQDRAFAAETALLLLAEVDAEGPAQSHRLVEEAVARGILGSPTLPETLQALAARTDPVATAATALLTRPPSPPVDPPSPDE